MKTVKHLLIVSTLVFFSNVVSAQFQFGGSIGIGGATQSEFCDIYNNSDLIMGYNAGLVFKNQFNDWFALKTNLNYSKKGSSFDFLENSQTTEQKERLNYLNIPLKAEFSTPLKNQKLFFATGPYIGFLLDAEKEVNSTTTNTKDQFKNNDFGFAFELGIIKTVSDFDLQFSIDYEMGFAEISEMDCTVNNKAMTFSVGVLF